MSDGHTFKIGAVPRMSMIRVKDDESYNAHWVRAYRQSPEDVYLQIRWKGRYVGVSLSFTEARRLAQHLLNEAGEG